MASLSSSYDGIGSLYNTYAYSSNASLQSYSESINNILDENLKYNNIASCKINFSNLGKLDFDFLKVSSTPLNMKLFSKIAKIDQNMRRINDIFIQLIVNMNCCFLASKYNDVIRTPMQNITKHFCEALVSIAEQAAKSYVIFKAYLCAIKPVPGNPWLKSAGFDWMRTIYSFLYGFEAFFDWIMDGTIINVINDPLETFIKKIQTCAPILDSDDPEFKVYLLAYQKMLLENQMTTINDYTSTVVVTETGKEVTTKGIENDPIVGQIIGLKEQYFKNDTRLTTLQSELSTLYSSGSKNIILKAEYDKLMKEQVTILNKIKQLSIEFNRKYSDQDTVNPREKQFLKDIDALQNQYYISQSEYSNVLLLKNKVSCNCLLTVLGITFNTSEDVEITNQASFDNINGRVLYKNKDKWKQAIEDLDAHKSVIKTDFLISQIGDIADIEFDQNEINNLKRLVAYGYSLDNYTFSFNIPDINVSTIQLSSVTESEGSYDIEKNLYTIHTSTGDQNYNLFSNRVVSDKDLFKTMVSKDKNSTATEVIALNKRREALIKIITVDKTKYDVAAQNEETKLSNAYYEIYNIYKVVAGNLSTYEFLNSDNRLKALDAKGKMNQMGSYFEPIKFIEFLIQWGTDIASDMDEYKQKVLKDNTLYVLNTYTTYTTVADSLWYEKKIAANVHKGAIKKLKMLLEYDHIVVSLVSEKSDIPCGCDIICKIIQWLVDLIISAINGLIKALIARLVSALINESVAYIIKFILAKLQCFKDIRAIPDKLKKVAKRADLLKKQLAIEYSKAPSPMYCDTVNNYNDLGSRIAVSEIPYKSFVVDPNTNTTNYQIPMVTFGSVDENTIVNEVKVSSDMIITDQVKNAYIPTLKFDCANNKYPYIALNTPNLEGSNLYEMNIIFSIGQFLNEAPVTSTVVKAQDVSNTVTLDDGSVITLPTVTTTSDEINAALAEVEAKLAIIKKTDVFITDNCKTVASYLDFCSLNDLIVSSFKFVNKDSTGVLDDSNNIYGTVEKKFATTNDIVCYFPEHNEADANGNYTLKVGAEYYEYIIPKHSDIVLDDTIEEFELERTEVAGEYISEKQIISSDRINDDKIVYTYIDDQIISETYSNWSPLLNNGEYVYTSNNEKIGKVNVRKVTKHNKKKYFVRSFLEFLAHFTNKVNYVDVRVLLDVVLTKGADENTYNGTTYLGRYNDYIVLGEVASSVNIKSDGSVHYYISKDRLAVLSKDILKDNYLLSQSLAEEIKKTSSTVEATETSTSSCMLTSEQKQVVATNTVKTELLSDALNTMINTISSAAPEIDVNNILASENIVTSLDPVDTTTTIENSIMFIMLSLKYGIAIQIVNKKIVLHIPSTTVLNSAKVVIDYTLEENCIYNFTYAVQGRQITITLMDESKNKYSATVMNIFGYDLLPEYIGGTPFGFMPTGMKTACSLKLYNIAYSNIGLADDYYKYTVLNTIPRTSIVTFDYSVVDITNRIYNVAATTNVTSINSSVIELLGVAKEKQKISGYGEVISNNFFQVYKGMLDNFFCQSNLTNFSYTLSVWFYVDYNASKNSRHAVISDDINNNCIYFNAATNSLIIDFAGAPTETIQALKHDWYCLFIEKYSYEKKYRVILTSKDFTQRIEKIIYTPIKFNLMSIGAEYIPGLNYTNLFEGLFGPVTVYIGPSTDSEKVVTCGNQYLQIKGTEQLLEV